MSTRWLIALLSVLVLFAGACESAEDGDPAELGTQDDTEEDQGPQQRLEDAVATTLDEGSAEFTSAVADSDAQSGTSSDTGGENDGTTDGADRTGETEIDGFVDFDQELSEMSLSRAGTAEGRSATAIIEQNDLYVQADDGDQVGADTSTDDDAADDAADDDTEEGTGENGDAAGDGTATDGQWAHMNVHELLDAEPAASQLLLHDPSPLLGALQDATVDVREGAATGDSATDDDGAATDDDQAEKPDLIATVDATESDEPALEALAEQTGSDELDVEVWVETATAANGSSDEDGGDSDEEDERIEQLAISVPAGPSGDTTGENDVTGDTTGENGTEDTSGEGNGTDESDTDENGTEDNGTDEGDLGSDDEATPDASTIGQDRKLTIELTNFGTEVNIEVPEDDSVVEVEAAELRGMFGDQRQGAEPTPTPDAGATDDDGATDG